MAKNPWGAPDKDSDPWAPPKKKANQDPAEFRKAVYEKDSLFGKKERHEGRDAGKASRQDRKGKR